MRIIELYHNERLNVFEKIMIMMSLSLSCTAGAAETLRLPGDGEGNVDARGKYVRPEFATAADREAVIAKFNAQLGVVRLDTDRYRIGDVVLNHAAKTVEFPAEVAQTDQNTVIEYAVGTYSEKGHESVFVTKVRPRQIHMACLLLDMSSFPLQCDTVGRCVSPDSQQIEIEVMWRKNGPDARYKLSECVRIPEVHEQIGENIIVTPSEPIPSVSWLYNGSQMSGPMFNADFQGGVIALMRDPDALVNYPDPSADVRVRFAPHTAILPPKTGAVKIMMTLKSIKHKGKTNAQKNI